MQHQLPYEAEQNEASLATAILPRYFLFQQRIKELEADNADLTARLDSIADILDSDDEFEDVEEEEYDED